jgi:hypothetical protein
MHNTRRFLEMCNEVEYPAYITTKNTADLPVDLLAKGNYVLGVSLASHRPKDLKIPGRKHQHSARTTAPHPRRRLQEGRRALAAVHP